jgi:hypothetical protein
VLGTTDVKSCYDKNLLVVSHSVRNLHFSDQLNTKICPSNAIKFRWNMV